MLIKEGEKERKRKKKTTIWGRDCCLFEFDNFLNICII